VILSVSQMSKGTLPLQEAGLVRGEKRGRERVYRLDRKLLRHVASGWLKVFSHKPATSQQTG